MVKLKLKKIKTTKIRLLEDELGKYIPYCNYNSHPGIPLDERKCERRNCEHYYRFRSYDKFLK